MDITDEVWYTPIVLGYIERDDAVLVSRRRPEGHQAGCWEFPGGKIEAGESPTDALRRELREELGIAAAVGEELAVVRYRYPEINVALHLFRCTLISGDPAPLQVAAVRWVPVAELATLAFPPANAALLARLAEIRRQTS